MAGGPRKVVHVEEEAKTAPEKVKNASRERGKGVWNRQGQVTLRVANPVVVSTILRTLEAFGDQLAGEVLLDLSYLSL